MPTRTSEDPQLAAQLLKAGKLVAFPTETVYGLGADATNADACSKIYAAKGRPANNPLIIHVADTHAARYYTTGWSKMAEILADHFWPGPLTMVLPKSPAIASQATAGRDSVAIRVPDHPLALEMLKAFGGPVAAPSANRSTRVSPTSADHVRSELGEKIELVLDGGQCPVGIESTVLDLTTFPRPTLLRPGSVSVAELEPLIGPIDVKSDTIVHASDDRSTAPASPGMGALHYAPATPAYRFSKEQFLKAMTKLTEATAGTALVALMSRGNIPDPHDVIPMPHTPDAYARVMYSTLRSADAGGYNGIYIELPPDTPEWLAVRDRLTRATKPLA